ncbi:MAG TPA: CHAT domain-containing protein [Chloroflexia bacterium]|nr:CHAT domain-containing protein [Chloroflexia bacterium]
MSNVDFQVDIAPNGKKLRLNVRANKFIPADLQLDRALLELPEADVKALRSGASGAALVQRVTAQLSEWFLGEDLNIHLKNALDNAGDDTFRLIINADRQVIPKLANLPIELIQFKHGANPVLLNPKIDSLVHLLPGVGSAQNAKVNPNWPLKVLIVRPNPQDLGGAIPEAVPLRDAILEEGQKLMPHPGPGMPAAANPVQVDLLSSEVGKAATWDALQEQLETTDYHILVYLGHGDVLPTHVGLEPGGVLQMESDNGLVHESVGFSQLTAEFQEHPVPVALLAGCMTAAIIAAKDPEVQEIIEASKSRWMQGSQGVAQALVDSEAGVQVSVGMRYMLETNAAMRFLKAFFRSLLRKAPGNVEMAVREARSDLFKDNPIPPSWSAPMLFRALSQEPMFAFMRNPHGVSFSSELLNVQKKSQQFRTLLWTHLTQIPVGDKAPEQPDPLKPLDAVESDLQQDILKEGSLLWPDRIAIGKPSQRVLMPVKVLGGLNLSTLQGRISVSDDTARVVGAEQREDLAVLGYSLFSRREKGALVFRLDRLPGNDKPLPDGIVLFDAEIELGPSVPTHYVVSLEIIETSSPCTLWPGNNVIIVPKLLESVQPVAASDAGDSTSNGNPTFDEPVGGAPADTPVGPPVGNATGDAMVSLDLETLWRSNSAEGKAARDELRDALLDAFSKQDLINLINGAFPNDTDDIDTSGSSRTIVTNLLTWAKTRQRLAEVVRVAQAENDSNILLQAFANKHLK